MKCGNRYYRMPYMFSEQADTIEDNLILIVFVSKNHFEFIKNLIYSHM